MFFSLAAQHITCLHDDCMYFKLTVASYCLVINCCNISVCVKFECFVDKVSEQELIIMLNSLTFVNYDWLFNQSFNKYINIILHQQELYNWNFYILLKTMNLRFLDNNLITMNI